VVINTIYDDLEKTDDKDDGPFSILKLGIIIWNNRVFNKYSKVLFKSSKVLFKNYLKHLKLDLMNRIKKQSKKTKSNSQNKNVSDKSKK